MSLLVGSFLCVGRSDAGAVGLDGETNVSPDYPQGNNAFTGKIVKVTVAQK